MQIKLPSYQITTKHNHPPNQTDFNNGIKEHSYPYKINLPRLRYKLNYNFARPEN